jgi:hypothetical protein
LKNEITRWLEESSLLVARLKPHDKKQKNKKKEKDLTREQKEKLKSLGYLQ